MMGGSPGQNRWQDGRNSQARLEEGILPLTADQVQESRFLVEPRYGHLLCLESVCLSSRLRLVQFLRYKFYLSHVEINPDLSEIA